MGSRSRSFRVALSLLVGDSVQTVSDTKVGKVERKRFRKAKKRNLETVAHLKLPEAEAEIMSLGAGLRMDGLPTLQFWRLRFECSVQQYRQR